jgi:mitochondrial fission protein ELM1
VNPPADAWLLTDGADGNRKQAEALAAALGCTATALTVAARAPWRWFAPRWAPASLHALGLPAAAAWPVLAIGCGRQGALALRSVRALSGGATRSVQILDPRIDPRAYDLVLVPAHDALRGPNVLVTRGALHAVDGPWLARARQEWARFGALPAPRTAVLLGGSNRAVRIDEEWWRGLARKLGAWLQRDGGSLLLSTSRRSPDWLRDAARAEFSAVPGVQWHGADDGPNPYPGLLAWADRLVVSPDSVNLLSEACATEAPVLVHLERPLQGKLAAFLRDLAESGRVRTMDAEFAPWAVRPLRETAAVAAQVRARLGLPAAR